VVHAAIRPNNRINRPLTASGFVMPATGAV
jgi:hypothetical protein